MQLQQLIGAGLLAAVLPVQASSYHVAQLNPEARDDGPGSATQPWKTLSQAAARVQPGDQVLIHDGVYREQIVLATSGTSQQPIVVEAAPGSHVVLTGADHLARWQRIEGEHPVYQVAWPHRFIAWSKQMTHPGDEYHRLVGRCEQVAIDEYLLRQVLEREQLAPGTFFIDVSNRVLEVWDSANRDLNKLFVEASVRQEILRVKGDYVAVRGLHFRFAANMAQHGAVVLEGRHDQLEDCELSSMNASGATFAGEDQVVRRCTFRDNGQLGFGASGAHRLLFTECSVENNNVKNFDRGWEAGGDKLVLCRDAVLDRSRFVRNRGNGIWFDIGNEHCSVQHCLIADNEDAGIFYEISFGLMAHDNVIIGNGLAPTPGAWGAQAGISLSSSPQCVIERNIIFGNREGFDFREQNRTTPRIGEKDEVPIWNHDQVVRHNLIAFNRDAQVWGWFDTRDDRHWPARYRRQAANHGARAAQAGVDRLALEQLQLQFDGNLYFATAGEGGFNWGTSWGTHTNYASLGDFRSALGIDHNSEMLDPGFANPAALDFRAGHEVIDSPCYPKGPVPGVVLGLKK
ncbi:MAG TPA: right-handed parallel beta-helix repeat-containing protein [Verrucomicrobiae bacterium]|nr:right-handed parallel beta-helix repeat-containing protein [Verrucomicrobiae bacterium]